MYATEVNGQVLNLAVSGKLWKRSLVMVDEETQSLWSHILGRGMSGKHKGTRLKLLPSTLTDWESWREDYPLTTVLMMSRTGKEFQRDFYRDPSRFVLGVSRGNKAKAWPFDQLVRTPLLNDTFQTDPVVVYFEAASGAGYVYQRVANETTLTFQQQGDVIIDKATKSTWNLRRGEAIAGPLQGTKLKAVSSVPSFRKAWDIFHPSSEYASAGQ